MDRVIANVYLDNGASRRVLTTPGRAVQFFGGHARITDHRDMSHMLQMNGVLVQPTDEAMAWAGDWLKNTREIKARVTWPDGWRVRFKNQDLFKIVPPKHETSTGEITATPTVSPPEVTVDLTARPAGWVRPEDLLEDLLAEPV